MTFQGGADGNSVEHGLGNSAFDFEEFGVAPSMAIPNVTFLPTKSEPIEASPAQDHQDNICMQGHQMVTRVKDGIHKPKNILQNTIST